MDAIRLCALEELPVGAELEGREFRPWPGRRESLFLVREGDKVHAYLNRCPHKGSPLNWSPDRFLDNERRYIVCATHGALFEIDKGICVAGPCRGDQLTRIDVEVRDGEVVMFEGSLAR